MRDVNDAGDDRPSLDPDITFALTEPAVWAPVPVDLRQRVMDSVFEPPAPPIISIATGRRKQRGGFWPLFGVVVAVAAVVGFGVGVSVADRSGVPDRVVAVVGTSLAPGVSGRVRVRDTGSGVELVVRLRGLPPVGPGRYYQGWVRGGSEAVAIGTFHGRGGEEPVVLWSGVEVEDYPVMTITVQSRGAGPASSGQVVATARLRP